MNFTLIFLLVSLVIGCSSKSTKKANDIVFNQEASSTILSAMGEVLSSANQKTNTACVTTKQNNTCELDSSNCKKSEFLLTVSGDACPINFYFKNEIIAVPGGARGTFNWSLSSKNPAEMPSYIKSITIAGNQSFKSRTLGPKNEVRGQVRLAGNIVTEKSAEETNKYGFIINSDDVVTSRDLYTSGRSEVELIISGSDAIDNVKKQFRTSLKEIAGFNTAKKSQTMTYLLDTQAISVDQFKLFSELGITFFFKSTPASESRPWLGYVGPFKDFLELPEGL